jgi:hypothetical protein
MTNEGQCFRCYDNSMFQYFGQTGEFSSSKVQNDYVSKLSDGIVVDCMSCGRKVKYVKTADSRWKEEAF